MTWLRVLASKCSGLFRKGRLERQLDEDVRAHLDMLVEENLGKGMDPEEARHAALRQFGNVGRMKEECRDRWSIRFIDELVQDIRFGLRQLRRNPGFTAVAVLTLALGIGANTAIFSSVNAMLIHPFAFQALDRAVDVWETVPKQGLWHIDASPACFEAWREHNKTLVLMAAGHNWSANLTGREHAERMGGYRVSADFFSLLGIAPRLGRTIAAGDFSPDRDHVVVLSYALWQRLFGADPSAVGKSLLLNGQKYSVIGVMPSDFDFPVGVEVWAPMNLDAAAQADHTDHYLQVFGRLKPGVSMSQAQADLATVSAGLARQYPATNAGHSVRVLGLVDDVAQGSRQFLTVLMGAAAFVLILACANVANLQLARATARQKEISIRRALGAGRARIAGQLLIESLLVSLAAGGAGTLLAGWGLKLLKRGIPPFIVQHIPGLKHLQVDPYVLLFTLAVSLLTGLLVGMAPAIHSTGSDMNAALKESTRSATSSRGSQRLRALFVVTEVALALVLLVGAGLMVGGFRTMLNANPGYDRRGVLTFRLSLPSYEYRDDARRRAFYQQLLARLEVLPGVESASVVTSLPSGWSWNQTFYRAEGQPPAAPGEMRTAVEQSVSPGFLRTLCVPLIEGRFFSGFDGPSTTPTVVLSENLARRVWPNQDPVGKRIRFGTGDAQGPWRTVVGVIGGIKESPFAQHAEPTAYFPYDQLPQASAGVMVRVVGDPTALAPAARMQARSINPDVPIYDVRTLEQLIGDNLSGVKSSARMMIVDGIIALLLAATGIFALMAYSVAQRTHDIGVRMALGALPQDVVKMLVGGSMKLAALGIAIGIPLAIALTTALESFLFGAIAMNIPILAGATLGLAAVAALAGYIPARRAAKVDPMVALRYE
ncbi:MAG: ABC transporter permease [Acidobacteriota bacterium]